MIRVSHVIAFPVVFVLLRDLIWHGGVLKQYENWSIFSIFARCGPFSQDFGQVLGQIILSFVKIVRVCCIFSCPILFALLRD